MIWNHISITSYAAATINWNQNIDVAQPWILFEPFPLAICNHFSKTTLAKFKVTWLVRFAYESFFFFWLYICPFKILKALQYFVCFYFESAKMHALLAYVLTCQCALSGYVLTCQRVLRASMLPNATCVLTCSLVNVPCVLTWSHPNVLCVLKCSRANVPCGLTCSRTNELCVLTCLRTNVPCVLTYQRADVYYVLTCQRALRTYVPLGKT